jgi:hypothetical protein
LKNGSQKIPSQQMIIFLYVICKGGRKQSKTGRNCKKNLYKKFLGELPNSLIKNQKRHLYGKTILWFHLEEGKDWAFVHMQWKLLGQFNLKGQKDEWRRRCCVVEDLVGNGEWTPNVPCPDNPTGLGYGCVFLCIFLCHV